MPELPTVKTPNSRRNSRPSAHLKTSRWALVYYTGHIRYHTGHVRCDQTVNSPSQLGVRTSELLMNQPENTKYQLSARRRNSLRLLKLPMNQPDNTKNFVVAGQIPDTSSINTTRPAKNKLALLSLKHSKLTWVGMSTYE